MKIEEILREAQMKEMNRNITEGWYKPQPITKDDIKRLEETFNMKGYCKK